MAPPQGERPLLEVARTFSRCALRIAAAKSGKRHREAATGRRGDPEISNVLACAWIASGPYPSQ